MVRMGRQYDVVIERDEDGFYVASVPQLHGCHTQAESLDELMVRIREAISLCLEIQGEPERNLEFIGVQLVTVAREQTATSPRQSINRSYRACRV